MIRSFTQPVNVPLLMLSLAAMVAPGCRDNNNATTQDAIDYKQRILGTWEMGAKDTRQLILRSAKTDADKKGADVAEQLNMKYKFIFGSDGTVQYGFPMGDLAHQGTFEIKDDSTSATKIVLRESGGQDTYLLTSEHENQLMFELVEKSEQNSNSLKFEMTRKDSE